MTSSFRWRRRWYAVRGKTGFEGWRVGSWQYAFQSFLRPAPVREPSLPVIDLWDELVLPRHVRQAWAGWLQRHRGMRPAGRPRSPGVHDATGGIPSRS